MFEKFSSVIKSGKNENKANSFRVKNEKPPSYHGSRMGLEDSQWESAQKTKPGGDEKPAS